jgi:hypothetical protein
MREMTAEGRTEVGTSGEGGEGGIPCLSLQSVLRFIGRQMVSPSKEAS